ncbi:glycosyltransferase [Endozoicomonas sp. ALB032]|uniref:glycosyltransferase n=1 Tax=Endozoicomonas sp. ALB032 TaxID=3403082 RepID=UPI003BB657B4
MAVKLICFLSSMHPPYDKRVFDKEAVYLSDTGFTVSHICPGKSQVAKVVKGVRIQTYTPPSGILGRLKQLTNLYRIAKAENADVYHCNEVDSWFIGVLLKIFHGKQCVFDVHEHYPSTFAQSRFPIWLQPLVSSAVKLVFRCLTPFTDRIVLAKRSVSDDFHLAADKKVLVQNFTPLSGLNFSTDEVHFEEKAIYTMVHLGLLNKNRGWPQIIDAMATMKHHNLHLLVIGEINDGSRSEFEQRVIELGLSNRVRIMDWMPFERAFSYLLKADIGIIGFQPGILNHVYAMPHKMFDYMAAGLAVLLPDFAVEVAPIVAETGCGLLIDSADHNDIAAKLDTMLDNPESIRLMGIKGKEAVKSRYNWELEVAKLIEMYKGLEQSR